ncbi:MAG: hypothetical protein HF314_18510 [Ignavibacteria bacterium]|jgi:hypothetical protein|nr:hypothetical protein [Ignavibacteria bacterium]MCU7505082.1 hypothetical protein [Ignavibacteria bacterium]MCU7518086.1 hypothetical protein [Ignavibacteria bacterium]
MKYSIILLCLLTISCSTERETSKKSASQLSKALIEFNVSKIDTTNVSLKRSLILSDTIHPQMSQIYPNPFSPVFIWYAFLPFADSLNLQIDFDKVDSSLKPLNNEIFNKGYYKIELKSFKAPAGVYFFKARYCDSIFVNKFIWLQ